jgi:hypothetical protein
LFTQNKEAIRKKRADLKLKKLLAQLNVPVAQPDDVLFPEDNDVVMQSESEDEANEASTFEVKAEDLKELFPGCKISKRESTALIYALYLRFKFSKACLRLLLDVINCHLLKGYNVPRSHYLLEKQLEPDLSQVSKSLYCDKCESLLDNKTDACEKCNSVVNQVALLSSGKYYMQFDIAHVLRNLLELPDVGNNLVKKCKLRSENDNGDTITDIVDGECYKAIELKGLDFTCTMNTDGVNVFPSGKTSMWPLFLSVNELDYKVRRNNTRLVALWVGKTKPDFETFLAPFVEQCNKLSTEGLTWSFKGEEKKSKVHVTMVAADSVARCTLQGIKQFNGYYSCPFCYVKGEKFEMEGVGHRMIFPPSDDIIEERTEESFEQDLETLGELLASKRRPNNNKIEHANGVINASPLLLLKDFNIVTGFTVDYMHTAILGVLKTLTTMYWLESKNSKEDYYLSKDKQNKIVTRFMRCKVPYEVNRSTRDLDEVSYWKANEWKTWLLVCIPILKGILPAPYLDHLTKFVVGLTLLLGDKIELHEIGKAESLLKEFCDEAPTLYGKKVCTFNMHQLNHFASYVRHWGPLWDNSMFQYEHNNGELTGLFCGTREIAMQIVKKLCILEKVRSSESYMQNKDAAKLFSSMMQKKTHYKHSFKCDGRVTMVGPRKVYKLNDLESKMLKNHDISNEGISNIWSYKHFFVRQKKFCTIKGDSLRCCNSIVAVGSKLYRITKALLIIYKNTKSAVEPVVFCNEIQAAPCRGFEHKKTVLKVTAHSGNIKIFRCRLIKNMKFISIVDKEGACIYVSRLLNSVEVE